MFSDFISKLQTMFSVTKSELITSAFILFFLVFGLIAKSLKNSDIESSKEPITKIYSKLDSLAEVNKNTITGTDNYGNSYEKLAFADTIIKKVANYGSPSNKPNKKANDMKNTKVNLNTASKVQLMKIPGIGEKTAIKILEYREKHQFTNVDDIMNIKGIGKKKFEKMKEFIEIK